MRVIGLLALLSAPLAFAGEGKLKTLDSGVQVIETKDQTFFTGLKQKPAEYRGLGETHVMLADCENLPEEFDLRDLKVVSKVRNQGQCGSCWAFSQTASLESAAATDGNPLDLSEQELVSCDSENYGCNGGMLNGFGYQIEKGQSLESDFPYSARDARCKSGLKASAKGVSYVNVGQSNRKASDKEVMCALYKSHTIPWIIVSATDSWGSMSSESDAIYNNCGKGQPNHAVGLVGWKTVNGKVYFKMRNSWGTSWGSDAGRPGMEKGYAMMKLGCDSLGEEIAYIVTKSMGCTPPLAKLPAEMVVNAGDEARLTVRSEAGVDYEWFRGSEKIATGDATDVMPSSDTVYKVVAKNSCGQAESSVRVKVLTATH